MNAPAPVASQAPGANKLPLIALSQLGEDFAYVDKSITEIEAVFGNAPTVVEDDEDIGLLRDIANRIAGARKRAETLRVDTKEPYLKAERVVDAFFKERDTKLEKWLKELEARAKVYLDKKDARERAHREEEARQAAQAAAEARAAADRAAPQAERAAAAERATAEARAATEAQAAKDQAAVQGKPVAVPSPPAPIRAAASPGALAIEATVAAQAAHAAEQRAAEAAEAASAKPADLARTRASGGMATLPQTWVHHIVDAEQIDLEVLRPHFALSDIEKAIGRYIATHRSEFKLQKGQVEHLNVKGEPPIRGVQIMSKTNAKFL